MFRLVLVFIFAVATIGYGSQEEKIVGGKTTTIEEHPYQISIRFENKHWCGGSLIRRNVVLTAAHCIENSSTDYLVRAGSNSTKRGGQVAQVTNVCTHPEYGKNGKDYDVSILKLNKPLNLNSAVRLIKLQSVGDQVQTNTMATVTGWGATKYEGVTPTNYLRKVEVPKVDQNKCEEMYGVGSITNRMTCYGYTEGGKDSCQADSGGPLVANGKQVGIVSWGIGCGNPNYPGIYTSLENEEIHHHINNCLAKFD